MIVRYPESLVPEARARADALLSGLVPGLDRAGRPVARPSSWLQSGADPSEIASVGYRLGMAASQWTAVTMLGLEGTRHMSFLPRSDLRRGTDGEADLYGRHASSSPRAWLIEAKGGARVSSRSRRRGAEQLRAAADRGWPVAHVQLLVAASAAPMLHVVADIATRTGRARPVKGDEPRLWPLGAGTGDPIELFFRRAFLAALIGHHTDRETSVAGTTALLADVPGIDLSVGLTVEAAEVTARQIAFLREISQSRRPVRSLESAIAHAVHTAAISATFSVAGRRENGRLELSGVTLETRADDPRPLVATDDAGVVVALGWTWT